VDHLSKKQLIAELRKRDEEIARLNHELKLMHQKMDLLIRRMFGRSSETLHPDQLDLFLLNLPDELGKVEASSLKEADPVPQTSNAKAKPRRERWPADLPVIEEIIEPKEVQEAPGQWRFIGAEVSEQLDYEPAKFLRRRLIRRKYVHRVNKEAPPVIAPLPAVLQERCIAAPGLLAAIIVGKYCDHLPLYRQESIFENRHRVYLPRASMARWMGLAADWLRPVYDNIRTGVMGSNRGHRLHKSRGHG